MIPGRTSLKVLMSKLGKPGKVGLRGRPMNHCEERQHRTHLIVTDSTMGCPRRSKRTRVDADTHIIYEYSRVSTQRQEFSRRRNSRRTPSKPGQTPWPVMQRSEGSSGRISR